MSVQHTFSLRKKLYKKHSIGLGVLLCVLVFTILSSMTFGVRSLSMGDVVYTLLGNITDVKTKIVVWDLRMPRTVTGVIVGAVLGVAGAIMQAITRNPLADPGIMGVNAGASFFAVLAIWILGITSIFHLSWFAFLGAAAAAIVVYGISNVGAAQSGSATPVRLALAGAAINAMLFAIIAAILTISQETLNIYRFWVVGSLQISKLSETAQLAPFMAVGMGLSLWLSHLLNTLALGDDTAKGLGENVYRIRLLSLLAITLLCGSAVSIAGPIAFVGLVTPHIARLWVGQDQRWICVYAMLLGAIILLGTDVIGRVLLTGTEIEVGIIVAFVGGPLFVWIVRRMRITQN